MDRCAKVNGKIHLKFIYNQRGLLKLALLIEISVGKILLAPSLNISDGIVSPSLLNNILSHIEKHHICLWHNLPGFRLRSWFAEEISKPKRIISAWCGACLPDRMSAFSVFWGFPRTVGQEHKGKHLLSHLMQTDSKSLSDSSIQDHFVWLNENRKAEKGKIPVHWWPG